MLRTILGLTLAAISPRACFAQDLNGHQIAALVRAIGDSSAHPTLERLYWAAQITLAVIAFIAAILALIQLYLIRLDSERQAFAALVQRTAEHNWRIGDDVHRQKAVEIAARLNVPTDEEGRKLYWATRLVHLSHVLLVYQVWVLAGRPTELRGKYGNWQRFATEVARDIRYAQSTDKPDAYKLACSHYWKALDDFEETEAEFVQWLHRISD